MQLALVDPADDFAPGGFLAARCFVDRKHFALTSAGGAKKTDGFSFDLDGKFALGLANDFCSSFDFHLCYNFAQKTAARFLLYPAQLFRVLYEFRIFSK